MTYTTIETDANDNAADGNLTITGNIDLEGTGADTTVTLDDTNDLIFEDDGNTNLLALRETAQRVDILGDQRWNGNIDLEGTGSDTVVTLDDTHDLVFEDDANTDILKIVEEGNIRLMQDANIIPNTDGQGSLGTSSNSWGSVTTGSIGNDGSAISITDILSRSASKGATTVIADAVAADNAESELAGQATDDVGGTKKDILTVSGSGHIDSGLAVVQGFQVGGSGVFIDAIHFSVGLATENVLDSITANTPAARSYNESSTALRLSMASDSYDVVTTAIVSGRDTN